LNVFRSFKMASRIKVTPQQFENLKDVMASPNYGMSKRMRTIFTLRNIGGKPAIDALKLGLRDKSVLLKHEIAFVLGQIGDTYAIPILVALLEDLNEDCMVRHEAAEALGAINQPELLLLLEKYIHDPSPEVSDTCQIAVDRIKYHQTQNQQKQNESTKYLSVDPAPPVKFTSTADLRTILLNKSLSLFERYRALFALRDRGDDESILAISDAFDDPSAVFRHELAYVLGQVQNSKAVPALKRVLIDINEHKMVRHEAAEALGSIATEDCLPLLEQFKNDKDEPVRESCLVALDILDYNNNEEFQYADGLVNTDN